MTDNTTPLNTQPTSYKLGTRRPIDAVDGSPSDEPLDKKVKAGDLPALFFSLQIDFLNKLKKIEAAWFEFSDLKQKNASLGWAGKRKQQEVNALIADANQWIKEKDTQENKNIPELPELSDLNASESKLKSIYVSLRMTTISLDHMLKEGKHELMEFYALYLKMANHIVYLQNNLPLEDISSKNEAIKDFNRAWKAYEQAQQADSSALWCPLGELPLLGAYNTAGSLQEIQNSSPIAFAKLHLSASIFKSKRKEYLGAAGQWKSKQIPEHDRKSMLDTYKADLAERYQEIKNNFNRLKELVINDSKAPDNLVKIADKLIRDLNTVLGFLETNPKSLLTSQLPRFDLLSSKLLQFDYVKRLRNHLPAKDLNITQEPIETQASIEQRVLELYDAWWAIEAQTEQESIKILAQVWQLLYLWHGSTHDCSEEMDLRFKEFDKLARAFSEKSKAFPLRLLSERPQVTAAQKEKQKQKEVFKEILAICGTFKEWYVGHGSPLLKTREDLLALHDGEKKLASLIRADQRTAEGFPSKDVVPFTHFPITLESVTLKQDYSQLVCIALDSIDSVTKRKAIFNQKQGYVLKDFCEFFYRFLQADYKYDQLGKNLSEECRPFFVSSQKIIDDFLRHFIIICQEITDKQEVRDKPKWLLSLKTGLKRLAADIDKNCRPELPEVTFAEMYCQIQILLKVLETQGKTRKKQNFSRLYEKVADCRARFENILKTQPTDSPSLIQQSNQLIEELNTVLAERNLGLQPLELLTEYEHQSSFQCRSP